MSFRRDGFFRRSVDLGSGVLASVGAARRDVAGRASAMVGSLLDLETSLRRPGSRPSLPEDGKMPLRTAPVAPTRAADAVERGVEEIFQERLTASLDVDGREKTLGRSRRGTVSAAALSKHEECVRANRTRAVRAVGLLTRRVPVDGRKRRSVRRLRRVG